ncbi:hypothetical protein INT48_005696 [Thamnidium elegans]|uniref:Uncharacterized protein n=1 Tax=Thamnidium elegans TaxID=101142 RepID=A0A8H7SRH3_9FUNG|nr:hypothetical protein INT48_005696 [Thamnidium elegans]
MPVFSGKEESLGSDFCKAYQLIWKAKEVCKETESIVENYMGTFEISFESDDDDAYNDNKVYLTGSLRSPKRN